MTPGGHRGHVHSAGWSGPVGDGSFAGISASPLSYPANGERSQPQLSARCADSGGTFTIRQAVLPGGTPLESDGTGGSGYADRPPGFFPLTWHFGIPGLCRRLPRHRTQGGCHSDATAPAGLRASLRAPSTPRHRPSPAGCCAGRSGRSASGWCRTTRCRRAAASPVRAGWGWSMSHCQRGASARVSAGLCRSRSWPRPRGRRRRPGRSSLLSPPHEHSEQCHGGPQLGTGAIRHALRR